MSQLHWMVSLIPDAILNWIYIIIILAGVTGVVAGWLGKWIPFYGNYAKFLQPLGVVLIALGLYLKGGYDTELAWRERVKEAEEKVKLAEQKSAESNTKIKTVVKEKIKVVRDVQVVVKERIKEVEKKIDADCKVDPEAINILNQAAGSKK